MRSQYLVHPDGSDSSDGSRPFRTVQRAVDEALAAASSNTVTISLAHGRYTGVEIAGPIPSRADKSGFRLHLVGDTESPDKVVIEGDGADALRASDDASVLVAGATLTTRNGGNLITATRRSTVGHHNCVLASAEGETLFASRYSEILALGPTTVTGDSHAFAHATTKSMINFSKRQITFAKDLHFKNYLWAVNDATIKLKRLQIRGRARGKVVVHTNGALIIAGIDGEWAGGSEPRAFDGGLISPELHLIRKGFRSQPAV